MELQTREGMLPVLKATGGRTNSPAILGEMAKLGPNFVRTTSATSNVRSDSTSRSASGAKSGSVPACDDPVPPWLPLLSVLARSWASSACKSVSKKIGREVEQVGRGLLDLLEAYFDRHLLSYAF